VIQESSKVQNEACNPVKLQLSQLTLVNLQFLKSQFENDIPLNWTPSNVQEVKEALMKVPLVIVEFVIVHEENVELRRDKDQFSLLNVQKKKED
jgi:hypothetical protein